MIIPRKAYGLFLLVLVGGSLVLFSKTVGQSLAAYFFGPHGPVIPYTTHIVLFQFKDGTSPFAIKEITSKFLGLKKSCVHPSTQRPYILSISGGKDISIENLQVKDGITHAFVLQFLSNQDRDYYVKKDPVHQAFKEAAGPVVEKAQVIDFQNGVFTNMG